MTSATPDLTALLELAPTGPTHEKAFFLALLDGTLYVHTPLSDDHPNMRLVMFARPDGRTVLPVFTDLEKALVAAQSAVRVVELSGRELIQGVPGATWMINPNDCSCTLEPQELASILKTGSVDRVSWGVKRIEDPGSIVTPILSMPAQLAEPLAVLFRNLRIIKSAYVFQRVYAAGHLGTHLLVVAVSEPLTVTTISAILSVIDQHPGVLTCPLDVLEFDAAGDPPDMVADVEPFFDLATPMQQRKLRVKSQQ